MAHEGTDPDDEMIIPALLMVIVLSVNGPEQDKTPQMNMEKNQQFIKHCIKGFLKCCSNMQMRHSN